MKNNRNKAKLIINNKNYRLKEFINNKEFFGDKVKINMILGKDISNICHMFENCAKLLEISIYDDDIINIDDKIIFKFEEFDYNINYNEYSYECNYDNNSDDFYNDNENIYSNCSELTKKEGREINHYNSNLTGILNDIIIYE